MKMIVATKFHEHLYVQLNYVKHLRLIDFAFNKCVYVLIKKFWFKFYLKQYR
jgi:hypothetical protein